MKYTIEAPNDFHFTPSVGVGLNDDQVISRRHDNLRVNSTYIARKNPLFVLISDIFTPLNIICVALMVILLINNEFLGLLLLIPVLVDTLINLIFDFNVLHRIKKYSNYDKKESKVVRNKKLYSFKNKDLVLDDIVFVGKDSDIIFDGLIADGHLLVDESSINGNNEPVVKNPNDMIYAGSKILSGNAYIRCHYVKSDISQRKVVNLARFLRRNHSPYGRFITISSWILFFVVAALFTLLLINYSNQGTLNNGGYTSIALIIAVSFPVCLYPLLSIMSIISVFKLSHDGIKVNDLHSINALENSDVILIDKTNTLTTGKLSVKKIVSLTPNYNQTDISQIMSNVLLSMEESDPYIKELKQNFDYELSKDILAANPYNCQLKYCSVTFKGGKSYLFGEGDNMNIVNRQGMLRRSEEYTKQGYKVLFLAEASLTNSTYTVIAFIVLMETLRDEVINSLKWLMDNGKAIKIFSGDNEAVTADLALKLGIEDADRVVSLKNESLSFVSQVADKYSVFVDANAEQKQIIVNALRHNKQKVAVIGDGDNDIYALKSADCSIAMGCGSPYAKGVSQMELHNNGFEYLPLLFKEGRRINNYVAKVSSLFLANTISLFVLALSFVIVSMSTNIAAIRFPFTFESLMIWEFLCTLIPAIFLIFDKNNEVLKGKWRKYIAFKCIPLIAIMAVSVGAIYIMFTLQTNEVIYTGITRDSDLSPYTSIQANTLASIIVCCLPLIGVFSVISFSSIYRLVVTIICSVLSLGSLAAIIIVSKVQEETIFGISINSISAANYVALVIVIVLSVACFILVKKLIRGIQYKTPKVKEEEPMEEIVNDQNQSND